MPDFSILCVALCRSMSPIGHRIIAAPENDFEVTDITRNGDGCHVGARASDVTGLHGEV